MNTALTEKELVVIRSFDAPRERLWQAWAEPDHFKKWWGPKDFTAPHVSIDFRVGGKYVLCMHGAGPDGVIRDFWNSGEYLEIVPMEKIITSMSFADEYGNPVPASHYGLPGAWAKEIMLTVTFEDTEDGKTKITVQEAGIPGVMTELAGLGWNESFDKLAESLK